MSEMPPPGDPAPPRTPGGVGWSVRQPAAAPPDDDWNAPLAAVPPALPAAAAPPAPPSAQALAPSVGAARRSMAPVWIAAVVAACLVFGAVVLVGHRSAAPVADSAAVSPVATAPPTPVASATPISAAAIQAGHEYLAVVGPLNAAETTFDLTMTAAMNKPCSCPAGEFDATPAMKLIPGINGDLLAFQATLERIKGEVPGLYADVDPVMSGNQLVIVDYTNALRGWQQNDPTFTSDIADVATQETAARADITRLRADLGLPPPPGGAGAPSSLTSASLPG